MSIAEVVAQLEEQFSWMSRETIQKLKVVYTLLMAQGTISEECWSRVTATINKRLANEDE